MVDALHKDLAVIDPVGQGVFKNMLDQILSNSPLLCQFSGAVQNEKIKKFGKCLIVDCHSFSGTPLPYEPEQSASRPSFCVGTLEGHSSGHLVKTAVKNLQNHGHSVALNYPYSGSMIPLKYLGDTRVQTIMIEINRSLYQQQDSLAAISNYRRIKNKIGSLLFSLSAAL